MSVTILKCPNCGAPIAPNTEKCAYCNSCFLIERDDRTGTPVVKSNSFGEAIVNRIVTPLQQVFTGRSQQQNYSGQNGENRSYYTTQASSQNYYQAPQQPYYTSSDANYANSTPPIQPNVSAPPVVHKSRAVALVLLIFFGLFGVHLFYLGKPARGIVYIVLTATGLFFLIFCIPLIVDFFKIAFCSQEKLDRR